MIPLERLLLILESSLCSVPPARVLESTYQRIGKTRRLRCSEYFDPQPLQLPLLIQVRFLYMLFLCIDANFRLKNQLVSNYSQDPGLGIGWAYMLPREEYEAYVLSRASDGDVSIVYLTFHSPNSPSSS